MIYYNKGKLIIRSLKETDAIELSKGFEEQGWDKPVSQFEKYLNEQKNQERHVFVAAFDHNVAGYVTLLPKA